MIKFVGVVALSKFITTPPSVPAVIVGLVWTVISVEPPYEVVEKREERVRGLREVLSNVAIPNSTHYSSFGFLKTVNDICNIIAPFDLLFGVLSLIWTFVLAIVKEF